MNHYLTIGWLYPDLMNIYGDRGNIISLTKRCEWRDIKVDVKRIDLDTPGSDIKKCDLLFMGGAQDRQQNIVSSDLRKKATVLSEMIEDNIPGLYICGAFQFLGKYYKEVDGTIIDGLDILDLYTENPGPNTDRLIGNIVIETNPSLNITYSWKSDSNNLESKTYLVGFENHGGRTHLGKKVQPLGKVIKGFGNNGKDSYEGAIYKSTFGSYFHGPILPKNPHFADHLITKALEKKYKGKISLQTLDDSLEQKAHIFIIKRSGP